MIAAARIRTSQLHDEALTDGLTGLPNRRAFDRDLAHEMARARRTSTPTTVAVIDLDHLKEVNDRHGHAAGDQVLSQMADALRAACRRSDRAYRIGGDEFALLLSDALVVEPGLLAARVAEAGAPPCTVGTASSPPDALEDLVELADRSLYEVRARERS
jgi:diguanylate cyclase (GGDEF)-like protein